METKEPSKINLRKNPDGSMTKVTIKKVQRKIVLKPKKKKPEVATPGGSKQQTLGKAQGGRGESQSKDTQNKKNKKETFGKSPAGSNSSSKNNANDKNKKKIFIKKKKPEWSYQKRQSDKTSFSGKNKKDHNKQNLDKKRTEEERNPIPKEIEISDVISVKNLAMKLNLKASEVMKKVFSLGVMGLTINDNIDSESAQIVAAEFGSQAKVVSLLEQTKVEPFKGDEKDYVPCSPIVAIMGHVDHGKTTLLDALRKSSIAGSEAGGITQSIGAYKVKSDKGEVLFIDTPGHSAFSEMRARGSKITDIIVLVVSAVDGVKPQTIEVIAHAKKANVPIVVAVNKMDVPGASSRQVIQSLSEHGLVSEEWGGEVIFQEISALKKTGLDNLLNSISLQAEMLDLKANPKIPGYGYVIESELKKGLGNTISVILKNGTLKIGDVYICGKTYGKIRALFDEGNKNIKITNFSNVVKIIGLPELVPAGEFFQVVESEKEAKKITDIRKDIEKQTKASNIKKVNLSNLYDTIEEEQKKDYNVIIKADTFGIAEAIKTMLLELKNEEIKVVVVLSAVGSVTESDLNLAITSHAQIICFKVKANPKIKKRAQVNNIKISNYEVIYDIVEDLKEELSSKLEVEMNEILVGTLDVKNIFKVSKQGKIAGCEVKDGKIVNTHNVRVLRNGEVIFKGKIDSLKRFKDDVKEVGKGLECGVALKGFEDLNEGDVIEALEVEKKEKVFEIS